MNIFQDDKGNWSSKRVMAFLFFVGACVSMAIGNDTGVVTFTSAATGLLSVQAISKT